MTGINKTIWQYLLATDGVNQALRSQPALDPANVKLDDRSLSELLRFVCTLATQVRYYGKNNLPQGDWQAFFDRFSNISETELKALISVKKDLSPHLALLLAFLQAYSTVKDDLNNITRKRLDYYYQDVLRLKRTSPQPDEVHVLFELNKNAKPTLVKAGSLVDAGKTSTALPLQYALENDIVVNQATVAMMRSSFTELKAAGKPRTFKALDATTVLNETATAWRPFGTPQLASPPESRSMQPVSFGWALASPNLLLAEGKRTVRLIMALTSLKGLQMPETILSSMLDIQLTTEKEWLATGFTVKATLSPDAPPDPEVENPYTLDITVELNEAQPAITAYNEAVHLAAFPTAWPVIRVLLKPDTDVATLLTPFRVDKINIEVGATGVKQLVLQNDQTVQPSDKPVSPFGSSPLIQSNFYIGSQEIFSKTVTSVTVNLEWQDPPESFPSHYSHYGNPHIANNSFATAVDLLNNRNWNVRLVNNEALFNQSNTTQVQRIAINKTSFATQTANAPFKRNTGLVVPGSFDNTVNQGFMRLVLIGPTKADLQNLPGEAPFEAFGHKTYPFAYTQQVLALSKWDGATLPKPELPKQPYTPVLKSVTVDYTAMDVIVPHTPNSIDQYFLQDVFGPAENDKDVTALLVAPQPGNGALYIGLENALAPQTLSFLLQIEEGSVEGETLLHSTDLQWSYLAGNRWQSIAPADVLEESTGGIQKPGIIRVNTGYDASSEHSLMPTGLHWVRVSVKDNPLGAASVTGIHTQAARALLVLPNGLVTGYEDHLAAPLPAQTISKLVTKIPAVKKLLQPYPSFGGRNVESDNGFYRRVSERLRHKNRAVHGWDYERLVLENFPEIYKIKCLPHSGIENSFSAGDVNLVVVPDWRKRPTGDPLQPRVNRNRLREIGEYVSKKFVSPFANVHVSNPSYETLLVDCKVSFQAGFDPGYHTAVLEEDIKKFLSPWAFEEGRDIVFGGKVHASEILAFIEGREYVDFVTDFELYHRHQGNAGGGISEMEIDFDFIIGDTPEASIAETIGGTGGKVINIDFVVGVPVEVASATRPDTILVSNGAHRIQALQANMSNCQGIQNIGIGQMIIGLDFVPIS